MPRASARVQSMSSRADALLEEALRLDRKERARIASVLLRSLDEESEDDPGDEELAEAWNQELARRSAQVSSGEVELVSWSDVKADARKLFAERRKN